MTTTPMNKQEQINQVYATYQQQVSYFHEGLISIAELDRHFDIYQSSLEAIGPAYDETSVTGQLDAILNDPLADAEEDGLTGKPYEDNETPITEEEARQVIEEMRRTLHLVPFGLDRLAQGTSNELGLEVDEDLYGWEEGQADQDYWQRVLAGQE